MTYLDLENNEIQQLPENLGELKNVTDLTLSTNQLEFLPESIGKLSCFFFLRIDTIRYLKACFIFFRFMKADFYAQN